jgi:N-acyl-D-aspartate/D-glutamate deacylase
MRPVLFLLSSGLLLAQPNQFDVLIAGAKVVDGSGNSWYYADVGIRGDTIAAVGMLGDVRRMSGYPAERLKLWDRGLVRPGMKADVVVFDPAKVADRAQYDKPHQYSVGVRDAIVNGKLVLHNDQVTTERSGRVLYGPAHQ